MVMLFTATFMLTTTGAATSPSTAHEDLDCLTQWVHNNYPGEHDVHVWYDTAALSPGNITLQWNDDGYPNTDGN